MNCPICNTQMKQVQNGKILNKYDISYYQCQNCFVLTTEKPYWLEEAYSQSINDTDTGLIGRNINLAKIVSIVCYYGFNDKTFLDYGGGYGIIVRMLRDVGFDFRWFDLYTENLFAKGFEYKESDNLKFELTTSFEAFEHFEYPIKEIENLLGLSDNLLFTTELYNADNIPKLDQWWYYGLEHGQHIIFYALPTLKYIADKYNLYLYTNNYDIHLLSNKKSQKLKRIFSILDNRFFSRILREVLYLYIKFKKNGKGLEDMYYLRDQQK